MSNEPSDHFFINNTLKVKPKHVTIITGDPAAINLAKERGFNVITTPELQVYYKRSQSTKMSPPTRFRNTRSDASDMGDNFDAYRKVLREIVKSRFTRPNVEVYQKISKNTGLPISVTPFTGRNFVKAAKGVSWSPSDFKHVVYDPASPVEHYTMAKYGLDSFKDRTYKPWANDPEWYSADNWQDRARLNKINATIEQIKQNIKPLSKGGKL